MEILEALWMGKISPIENPITPGGQYHQILSRTIEVEDNLRSIVTPYQQERLRIYFKLETEMRGIAECNAFSCGFRLGMQLLLAGMDTKKKS